jgi:hypothetical protein
MSVVVFVRASNRPEAPITGLRQDCSDASQAGRASLKQSSRNAAEKRNGDEGWNLNSQRI